MLGEGISITDLMTLLQSIRAKRLTLQVKIIDNDWQNISPLVIKEMIVAVNGGKITKTEDIRLRLFQKDDPEKHPKG